MKKENIKYLNIAIVATILFCINVIAYTKDELTIGIVKYKGGDWYDCKNGVNNFLLKVKSRLNIPIQTDPPVVDPSSDELFLYPIILINGHGQILLDSKQKERLKRYLENGGFLIVNDDYGIDKYFRELVKDMLPEQKLVKLPVTHPIFSCYYKFPKGLPKIHKHDDEPAVVYGIYINKKLSVIYIYSSDIVDGWEKEEVHNDPSILREEAYQFGVNILWYVSSY